METADWIMLGVGIAILGFLWNLHRDMADLRERMARVEGALDVLTKFMMGSEGFTGRQPGS